MADIVGICDGSLYKENQIFTVGENADLNGGHMEGQFDKLEGKKHDGGKPPMALLSGAALMEVAKVLEFGAKKYDSWNWKGGFKWSRLASAVLRHIFSWLSGEDKDPETGLSHLSHAACGIMFLIDFEVNKLGTDDRYKSNVK